MCPQELEKNVWEWCNDKKEYTDIKYFGLSINDMAKMGYDKTQFLRIIDVLNKINTILYGEYNERMVFTLYITSIH